MIPIQAQNTSLETWIDDMMEKLLSGLKASWIFREIKEMYEVQGSSEMSNISEVSRTEQDLMGGKLRERN